METNGHRTWVRPRTTCRICAKRSLFRVLSLGTTPLANAFLRPDQLARPEPRFPLEVVRCRSCGLVQLHHTVNPERLFREYVYFSSATRTMPAHFAEMAAEARSNFGSSGLVVEVGSNDGTLLKNFLGTGMEVLGIEPARNIAHAANAAGVRTWNEFFSLELADRIRREMGRARLVFANNVLAHIDDLHGIAEGVARLLAPEGAWMIEVPHLAEMIRHVEFDTIYHEHLCYFSLPPLERLFSQHGLVLTHVDRVPVHGGSLRLTVRPATAARRPDSSVARARAYERRVGLHRASTYLRFRKRVDRVRKDLPRLLADLRGRGHRIVGYGAPAKGNTLLNACRVGPRHLDYLLDTTPAKQGLVAPGSRLPVRDPQAFHDDPPDYALMLAWNFEPEILLKEAEFLRRGGRFIRPIPEPRLVSRPSKARPEGPRARPGARGS